MLRDQCVVQQVNFCNLLALQLQSVVTNHFPCLDEIQFPHYGGGGVKKKKPGNANFFQRKTEYVENFDATRAKTTVFFFFPFQGTGMASNSCFRFESESRGGP